jgi:hypothetical protein
MIDPIEIPDIDLNFDHRIENNQLREQLNISEAKNKNLTNTLIGIGVIVLLTWIGFEIYSFRKKNKEDRSRK